MEGLVRRAEERIKEASGTIRQLRCAPRRPPSLLPFPLPLTLRYAPRSCASSAAPRASPRGRGWGGGGGFVRRRSVPPWWVRTGDVSA